MAQFTAVHSAAVHILCICKYGPVHCSTQYSTVHILYICKYGPVHCSTQCSTVHILYISMAQFPWPQGNMVKVQSAKYSTEHNTKNSTQCTVHSTVGTSVYGLEHCALYPVHSTRKVHKSTIESFTTKYYAVPIIQYKIHSTVCTCRHTQCRSQYKVHKSSTIHSTIMTLKVSIKIYHRLVKYMYIKMICNRWKARN